LCFKAPKGRGHHSPGQAKRSPGFLGCKGVRLVA